VPTTFSIEHDGRLVEVVPDGSRVHMRIDGEPVAEAKPNGAKTKLEAEGVEVRVVMPWHGVSITRAELVVPDGPIRLVPEPGSTAARRERFEREHPGLYAARHVAKGVAQVAGALIGIGLLINFLPDISLPLPSIDLPDLPDLPLPSIDVSLPGWIAAILATTKFWLPIVLGLVIALREWRRRRTAGTHPERGGTDAQGGAAQRPDQQSGQAPVP
jgi:hypothetical protein